MRAHKVEARDARTALMERCGLKKKDITLEPCEIPTQKADLLAFLNDTLRMFDLQR